MGHQSSVIQRYKILIKGLKDSKGFPGGREGGKWARIRQEN